MTANEHPKFDMWCAEGELAFEIPGKVIVSIDENRFSYALFDGEKWQPGSFDMDKNPFEAGREILAALKALEELN